MMFLLFARELLYLRGLFYCLQDVFSAGVHCLSAVNDRRNAEAGEDSSVPHQRRPAIVATSVAVALSF